MTALYYETSNELYHHGVKGMKWGVHKKKYITVRQAGKNAKQAEKEAVKALNNSTEKHTIREYGKAARAANKQSIANDKAYNKQLREERKAERNTPEAQEARRKKALKVGAAVAGTALAAYGAKKLNDYVRDENHKLHMKKARETVDEYLKQRDIVDRTLRLDPNHAKRFEVRWAEDKHYVKDAFRNAELDAATDSIGKAAKNVIDDRRKRR